MSVAPSGLALTLVRGCDRIHTCDGSSVDGNAILLGGRQVLGLLPPHRPAGDAGIAADPAVKLWDGVAQAASWCLGQLAAAENTARRWSVSSSVLVLVLLVFTLLLALRG